MEQRCYQASSSTVSPKLQRRIDTAATAWFEKGRPQRKEVEIREPGTHIALP